MPKQKFKAPLEMQALPERLALALKEAHVSQNELARRIGVSSPSIGARMSVDGSSAAMFVLIAKKLNVRVGWLLVGEGEMREEPPPQRHVLALEPDATGLKEAKRPRRSRD